MIITNHFQCTKVRIVFKNLFDLILNESFNETDAANLKLSMITTNKYVYYPFISKQEDFGYSDIPIMVLILADIMIGLRIAKKKFLKSAHILKFCLIINIKISNIL